MSDAQVEISNTKHIWLNADEPAAFELINAKGSNDLIIIVDHASNRVPNCLHQLGLGEEILSSHIAWDAGSGMLARNLSELLDAPLVQSNYSRLVIDCNRDASNKQSILESSAGIEIPGNRHLGVEHIASRKKTLFDPYHLAIERVLDTRKSKAMLSIHSFNPILEGKNRPWSIGVCYGNDRRIADVLLPELVLISTGLIGDNEPYTIEEDVDYSLPYHAASRNMPHVMLEIRRDKIETVVDARAMAKLISKSWSAIAEGIK